MNLTKCFVFVYNSCLADKVVHATTHIAGGKTWQYIVLHDLRPGQHRPNVSVLPNLVHQPLPAGICHSGFLDSSLTLFVIIYTKKWSVVLLPEWNWR